MHVIERGLLMPSLINETVVAKDPTKLLYLYPSMPKIRYAKMVDSYYKAQAILAAEKAAKANNCLLVPARCIHYKRRDQSRRITIYGRSYYIMPIDDMTDLELAKYKAVCEEQGEIAI